MPSKEVKTKRMGNAPIDVHQLNVVETLPEAGVEYRGTLFVLVTDGLEDRTVTCLQKADGTFGWFEATLNEIL